MSGEPRVLNTVEEIDAEIARLTEARKEQRRLTHDPEEREKRRIRREQLAGRWVVTLALEENHLQAIRELAGAESWLFDLDLLQSDGWTKDDNGQWALLRQSPRAGADP